MNNPYQVNRYAVEPSGACGARGVLSSVTGMVTCVVAMGALCFGMMYLMWRVSGR